MLIKKKESKEIKIASDSYVWEYNFGVKEIGLVKSRINGRYPDEGRKINKACKEYYYVLSGSGKVFIEDECFEIKEGDTILIDSGKVFHVIGEELVSVCPTAPGWYAEQEELVK